ncbi:MAG: aminopeptidase P N-terminal domain-containing protein [Pseudanabaenaceae cyanobacterium SKYGB_i_bin29]|nr:aminopeptidase P N-terminal domain-containing protein [Pseudanabaenaceae cyanobacterium SKYG29]MDW8421948.1 aminopeptidase P N-terminal domain-containing protein [Pseudanabaenaceae cyanobacterium SKYGB_i_bin29]
MDWLQECAQRRAQLMAKLGSGAMILASAPLSYHHKDVEHKYRQDGDLYYFTGFPEPETVAVIAPQHPEHRFVLFVRPKDKDKETWSGHRVGVENAKTLYGADAVYPIGELDDHLPKYLETADTIYYTFGQNENINQKVLHHYRQLLSTYSRRGKGPKQLADSRFLTTPLRQCKSDYELAQIRQAVAIAVQAHQHGRAVAQPGMYEYELEALLEADFRKAGAMGSAYPTIVASGANSCILHYTDNSRQMQAGDLVLIDAGCCFNYYNSDITRTFPLEGRFTPEQQAVYDIVLTAQKQAIAQVQPGNTINAVHQAAVTTIVEGLLDLGLLTGSQEEIIAQELYKPFFMHRTSHWLGIDVHDSGFYKQEGEWTTLTPGMVITVEPGIYISPTIELPVPDHWRGIGIRIEDDVLVTDTGQEVLTAALEK